LKKGTLYLNKTNGSHLIGKLLKISFELDSEGKEKCVAIFRFLHAYMDGFSFLMMAQHHFSASGLNYYVDPLKFKLPLKINFLFYLNFLFKGPYSMLLELNNKFNKIHWNLPQNTIKSGKRVYTWAPKLKLEKIQAIRKKTGSKETSVTNVIITVAAIALAKILPEKKKLPQIQVQEIIALLPYPNSNPQNRFTAFTYPVSMRTDEPMKTLKSTTQNCFQRLIGALPLCYYYALKLVGHLPSAVANCMFYGTNHTICYSNIPLSRTYAKCFGTNLLDFYAYPPQRDDNGTFIILFSPHGSFCDYLKC